MTEPEDPGHEHTLQDLLTCEHPYCRMIVSALIR